MILGEIKTIHIFLTRMCSFLTKQTTQKDLMKNSKLDSDSIRLAILTSIILQWSRQAKCHARYLCKASSWEAWWNTEGGRQKHRKTKRQREIRSRPGFCSVCWMSVFHASLPPPHLSWVYSGTDSVSESTSAHVLLCHVRYFLRCVEVNYTSRLAQ